MMKKIQMNTSETMDETFERFIIATKSKGTGDKTLKTYREQYIATGFFSSNPSHDDGGLHNGKRHCGRNSAVFER